MAEEFRVYTEEELQKIMIDDTVEFSEFEKLCMRAAGHNIRITYKDGHVEETYCIGSTHHYDDEDGRASIDIPYTWVYEDDIEKLEILDKPHHVKK